MREWLWHVCALGLGVVGCTTTPATRQPLVEQHAGTAQAEKEGLAGSGTTTDQRVVPVSLTGEVGILAQHEEGPKHALQPGVGPRVSRAERRADALLRMTVIRVLPEDLYDRVMHGDEKIEPGEIFEEIVKRRKEQNENA